MGILIALASRHGSTREIAEAIGDEVRSTGIDADVRDIAEVTDLGPYEAVILGSAVYMGRWLPAALTFADANKASLRAVPVWLFSSGPIGDPPLPAGDPQDLDRLATALGAREHRVFAGRLDSAGLGWRERLVVKMVHAQPGEVRPWEEIRAWAGSIAGALALAPDGDGAAAPSVR